MPNAGPHSLLLYIPSSYRRLIGIERRRAAQHPPAFGCDYDEGLVMRLDAEHARRRLNELLERGRSFACDAKLVSQDGGHGHQGWRWGSCACELSREAGRHWFDSAGAGSVESKATVAAAITDVRHNDLAHHNRKVMHIHRHAHHAHHRRTTAVAGEWWLLGRSSDGDRYWHGDCGGRLIVQQLEARSRADAAFSERPHVVSTDGRQPRLASNSVVVAVIDIKPILVCQVPEVRARLQPVAQQPGLPILEQRHATISTVAHIDPIDEVDARTAHGHGR
mmetsp:Transcript_9230/g.21432  ORF Transcript_9230/g.21432 Transcript_9230/m.21432 type:complete len:278 (-) Transcript_9230:643-1476(-)